MTAVHPVVAQLVEARKAKGMSRRDLAAVLHLSQSTVAHMEQGRHSPTLAKLDGWAEAVGLAIGVAPRGEP